MAICDAKYSDIMHLRIEDCCAAREEDKQEILSKIQDHDAFNETLQWLIFAEGGLLGQWLDAEDRAVNLGRLVRRVVATPKLTRRGRATTWEESSGHARAIK